MNALISVSDKTGIVEFSRALHALGIQLLSRLAMPVRIGKSGGMFASGPSETNDSALLLSTAPDSNGEVGMVLREGIYNARDSLDMVVNNKPYLLMPSRLAEGGEDFDWAMFKVMQRST